LHASGIEIELTALQVIEGYEFRGWSGDVGEWQKMQNPLILTVVSDLNLTATFSLPSFEPNVSRVDGGVLLEWDNNQTGDDDYGRFVLQLLADERPSPLFDGGHGFESAFVDYDAFGLSGNEVLRGSFSENNPKNGEWVRQFEWFEIDLSNFPEQPEKILNVDSNDLGFGWRQSNWFGVFMPSPNGWLFHTNLGWVYAVSEDEHSIWIWDETLGWYWTNSNIFPFLYVHSANGWYYLNTSLSHHERSFFDYSSARWIRMELLP
jgi:hypothetical protein